MNKVAVSIPVALQVIVDVLPLLSVVRVRVADGRWRYLIIGGGECLRFTTPRFVHRLLWGVL